MGDAVFAHFLFRIEKKACEAQENVIISLECTQTYTIHKHDTEIQEGQGRLRMICGRTEPAVKDMKEKTKYFVVREKAVPEVLLKVVEAKRMLDTKRAGTVQEAADLVGISRSSFYKYKDDIFPFRDNIKGKTLTFVLQMHDEPGLLSDVLKVVAEYGANIQTLHQSIPINGVATLTISVEVLATTGDISNMIETIESKEGIQYLKILARE